MTVTIQNTSTIVLINGIPARLWEGHTASGIKVHCFITRIAVANEDKQDEFLKELEATAVPIAEFSPIPLRMII